MLIVEMRVDFCQVVRALDQAQNKDIAFGGAVQSYLIQRLTLTSIAGWLWLCERDGTLGFTFRGRIECGKALEVVFGGAEFERGLMNAARQSDELHFSVGVGAGFEIEAADASESVGDMDLDSGGVDGFGIGIGDGQVERAWAGTAIHDRNFLCRRRGLLLGVREGTTQDEQKWKNQIFRRSFHVENYRFRLAAARTCEIGRVILASKEGHPSWLANAQILRPLRMTGKS